MKVIQSLRLIGERMMRNIVKYFNQAIGNKIAVQMENNDNLEL